MEAYGLEEQQVPFYLAVSESKLTGISRSADRDAADAAQQYEVRVRDLGTLECEHTLQQPVGSEVYCLAAGPGQVTVYGGVGVEVVVWGRDAGLGGGGAARTAMLERREWAAAEEAASGRRSDRCGGVDLACGHPVRTGHVCIWA